MAVRSARVRPGSTCSTVNQLRPSLASIRRCPTSRFCHSGTMRSALGFPELSSLSQLYQARPWPICASHGQTFSGGAGRVVAIVNTELSALGISSSPG